MFFYNQSGVTASCELWGILIMVGCVFSQSYTCNYVSTSDSESQTSVVVFYKDDGDDMGTYLWTVG